MLCAARRSLVPAVVAAWLLMPALALAIVPQVQDRGGFFSPEAVLKANAQLLKIQEKHKKDVIVETYDKIPEDVLQRIKYDPKDMNSFFDQWAKEIGKKGKVNGIVILICKNQKNDNKTRIQEEVGEHTREQAFKENDRVDLHSIFLNKWSKDKNAALLEALQFIDGRMTDHHKTPAKAAGAVAQPSSRSGSSNTATDHGSNILGWVCIGVCVLVGIWLVFGLIRAFSGGGGGGYAGGGGGGGGGYGYGGGGGGFMSGLMGGLFGAMAGNWIYNNMFGGHSYHQSSWGQSSANAAEPGAGGRDDFGPSDQGQGFSGGGGDVDGGGGGGDVDSGDAGGGGGGDGGGDWGGGGGDWGGGGGDAGGGGDWGGGGGGGDWGGGGGGGGDFGGGGGGDW